MKHRISGIIFLAVVFFSMYYSLFSKRENPEVYVVLRYDDYCNTSSLVVENEFLKAISAHGITCTFGIIPFIHVESESGETVETRLDSSKVELIGSYVKKGSIEVSLHGYSHISSSEEGRNTEFKGQPASWQEDRISRAKGYLENLFGEPVLTFIPPWNSYDLATLDVLASLDFKFLSADNLGLSSEDHRISYLPATASIPQIEKQMDHVSLPYHNSRAVFVLMMHDYDFVEIDSKQGVTSLDEFRVFMDRLEEKNWNVVSIKDAGDKIGMFPQSDYRFNRRKQIILAHLSPLSIIPGVFPRLKDLNHFYLAGSQVLRLSMMLVIFYLGILLVFSELLASGLRMIGTGGRWIRIILGAFPALFVLSMVYFWIDDRSLGKNEMLILILLASVVLGTFYYMHTRKRAYSGNL